MNEGVDKYVEMLTDFYSKSLTDKTLEEVKPIIGIPECFDDKYRDIVYDMLFDKDYREAIALDFGCGIGRLIKWFHRNFKYIYGVDISTSMIWNAKKFLSGIPPHKYSLSLCNGYNLSSFIDDYFDVIYSVAVLEHICVWEIRCSYFNEFYRILKKGGSAHIGMKCGFDYPNNGQSSEWYANDYYVTTTNSMHDVRIDNLSYITADLSNIGFRDVHYRLFPLPPDDQQPYHAGHQYNLVIIAVK